ncbi:serine/threonine-protein kinase pakF-like [Aplysia californica]|uniref:Serine/threonine-protein kinase pakF-like n=1 Tax=Aplysia californica TaxID=6500 RepID=A0ABM0JAJ4_APLCA|nr:serine/threonine-protein kinase pakF-like [Aplysia californica]
MADFSQDSKPDSPHKRTTNMFSTPDKDLSTSCVNVSDASNTDAAFVDGVSQTSNGDSASTDDHVFRTANVEAATNDDAFYTAIIDGLCNEIEADSSSMDVVSSVNVFHTDSAYNDTALCRSNMEGTVSSDNTISTPNIDGPCNDVVLSLSSMEAVCSDDVPHTSNTNAACNETVLTTPNVETTSSDNVFFTPTKDGPRRDNLFNTSNTCNLDALRNGGLSHTSSTDSACNDTVLTTPDMEAPSTSYESVFRSPNREGLCNDNVLGTTNIDIAYNDVASHASDTGEVVLLSGPLPSDTTRRKRKQRGRKRLAPDALRELNTDEKGKDNILINETEVCDGGVVIDTDGTCNNGLLSAVNKHSGTCAIPGRLVLGSTQRKRKRRQKKRRTQNVFSEKYEPTGEKLGHGSFGSVLTYKNKESGVEYAVKIIENCLGDRLRRVFKEINICRRYKDCEYIINLVDFYEYGNTFYLVFDKMAGGDLEGMFNSYPFLTEPEASRAVGAVAQALLVLHSDGVAHRDIKPENILCRTNGEVTSLVLCDFGLASESPSPCESPGKKITRPVLKSLVGSPEFMAPEVATLMLSGCEGPYDTRCDMWSLGVLLYEMLFGFLPFDRDCGRHVRDSGENCIDCYKSVFPRICSGEYFFPESAKEFLSDDAVDLIRGLLVVDPNARYSAADVLQHPFVTANKNLCSDSLIATRPSPEVSQC